MSIVPLLLYFQPILRGAPQDTLGLSPGTRQYSRIFTCENDTLRPEGVILQGGFSSGGEAGTTVLGKVDTVETDAVDPDEEAPLIQLFNGLPSRPSGAGPW